jgi:transcriptional regulator with XRE-family HTH domain
MSNERLRAAIVGKGHTIAGLAEQLQVDPKTVERWITKERVPHRAHRLRVAGVLGQDDAYLWPATASDAASRSASEAELVTVYPNRGSVPPGTWESLVDRSTESIDLLAYAASFLHDSIPDFGARLAARARAGVRLRLLFGDPDSPAVALRGEEEAIGDLLAARCRLSWRYFAPVIAEPAVFAREHGCTLYNSVFRFDDTLLANTHLYGTAASQAPVTHLQRITGGRLFDSYQLSFERTWEQARAVQADQPA